MNRINYLVNDIWDEIGDDRVADFYLMKGNFRSSFMYYHNCDSIKIISLIELLIILIKYNIFFKGGPMKTLSVIFSYLLFVKYIGPKFMVSLLEYY